MIDFFFFRLRMTPILRGKLQLSPEFLRSSWGVSRSTDGSSAARYQRSSSHSWSTAAVSSRCCVSAGVSLNTPRGWSVSRRPRSRTDVPPCGFAGAAPGCQGDWSSGRTAGSGAVSRPCAPGGGVPGSASVWSVSRRSHSSAAARRRRRTQKQRVW